MDQNDFNFASLSVEADTTCGSPERSPTEPLGSVMYGSKEEAELGVTAAVKRKLARIKESMASPRSGISTRAPRRDIDSDWAILTTVQTLSRVKRRVTLASQTGAAVYKNSNLSIQNERNNLAKAMKANATIDAVWTPSWDHAGECLKLLAMVCAITEEGGYTFNLHLSDERIAKLGKENLAQLMQELMARRLKQELGSVPPFVGIIEHGPELRLHFHGAIAISQDPEHLKHVKAALRVVAAAGAKRTGRELKMKPIYGPIGWASYILKGRHLTHSVIGEQRLIFRNDAASRLAKAWYVRVRETGENIADPSARPV